MTTQNKFNQPPTPANRDLEAAVLWEKLRGFSFDAGNGPRTFARRLAAEQGWSEELTARAIEEYRRFLLLFGLSQQRTAASSDDPVSVRVVPSEIVDKVWHLHLLYTENYYAALCRDRLGAFLHHRPADGSEGESESLSDVYRANMVAYEAIFGEPAPQDIWPAPVIQPASPLAMPNVSVAAPRVTPKPGESNLALGFFGGAGVLFLAIVIGMMAAGSAWLGSNAAVALMLAAGLLFGAAILAEIFRGATPGQGRPSEKTSSRGTRRWATSDAGVFSVSCGGGGSDATIHSGAAGGHHSDGGSHGGGHGHSCGGHSCGGHGCGGHGCGGGGCGGH